MTADDRLLLAGPPTGKLILVQPASMHPLYHAAQTRLYIIDIVECRPVAN